METLTHSVAKNNIKTETRRKDNNNFRQYMPISALSREKRAPADKSPSERALNRPSFRFFFVFCLSSSWTCSKDRGSTKRDGEREKKDQLLQIVASYKQLVFSVVRNLTTETDFLHCRRLPASNLGHTYMGAMWNAYLLLGKTLERRAKRENTPTERTRWRESEVQHGSQTLTCA